MLFNSYSFLLWFLPISLIGFYLLGHTRPGGARIWLIGASFFFYGWWNAKFVLLLLASIGFNYGVSLAILNAEQPERQRLILTIGIVSNLAALVYYKYLFWLLGLAHEIGWIAADAGSVILPLGISFFTFTQIGYIVDCQQGLVRERGLVNYALFVTFFPHLIAGPILHHREIMPQFADDATYRLNGAKLTAGFTLFRAWACEEGGVRQLDRALRGYGFRSYGAACRAGIVVHGVGLFDAIIFRLFRLFGHGGRAWRNVRRQPADKL